MRKLRRFLVKFVLCGMFLFGIGFLGLTLYYRRSFPVNTWINGVYCTGKTVEQVNEELINAQTASTIYVLDAERVYWEIDMKEANVRLDYTVALESYIAQRETFYWLNNIQQPVLDELTAKYSIDQEKLLECFEALSFIKEEQERPAGVFLCCSEDGYYLEDNNIYRLDCKKAFDYLTSCLLKGQRIVDLKAGGCYADIEDSADDKVQRDIWRQLEEFVEKCSRLVYDMGTEQIEFADIATQFLETEPESRYPSLDSQGKIILSDAKIREWVELLALNYDTCGTEKQFQSTRGDIVAVKYVTYGTKLDVEAETAYLREALRTNFGEKEYHIPTYSQEGFTRGLDDIGGTYIEIDMTEQKIYYYVDGEIMLEADIVTGNTGRNMGTPEGINFIYAKQRNRTLRGPGYASFVKYWMPVKGNIGIHDASWRAKFGGEIYKTNGSHGCINMPGDIAGQLYEMVEIGTPVVMFY